METIKLIFIIFRVVSTLFIFPLIPLALLVNFAPKNKRYVLITQSAFLWVIVFLGVGAGVVDSEYNRSGSVSTKPVVAILIISLILIMIAHFRHGDQRKSLLVKSRLPYELQKSFLSDNEHAFYHSLRGVLGDRMVICPKVRLADVFRITDYKAYKGLFNRISQKHIDFLLCDPVSMVPILGIELDDSSHNRDDRRERDEFVNAIFRSADLQLLHIPARSSYPQDKVYTALLPYLTRVDSHASFRKPSETTISGKQSIT